MSNTTNKPEASRFAEDSCESLCWDYNTLTNPGKLRTEEEHAECRAEASKRLAEITRRFVKGVDYIESESGRLLPTPWTKSTATNPAPQERGKLKSLGMVKLGHEQHEAFECETCGTIYSRIPYQPLTINGVVSGGLCPWCRSDSKPWMNGRGL